MSEALLSVGLDIGTTTTQMILSRLSVENKAGSFSVPELAITDREILYRSDIRFTPLIRGDLVDAAALGRMLEEEYTRAGIRREDVDTGAVIITGETSRKENAAAVLEQLSGFAGEFVVATAGPELESVLAAKGAGAVEESGRTGKTLLHMDIGGGTANLALIREGKIIATGCMNVGGRLIRFDERGKVIYLSPVLEGLCDFSPGGTVTEQDLYPVARMLASALEMAAGLREKTELADRLWTKETATSLQHFTESCRREGKVILTFSGGVADCICSDAPWTAYGDLGVLLGRAIRESRLCRGEYVLGKETIRATVIGAGCHSTTLSGSTVFYRNVDFPLKNLPVVSLGEPVRWEENPVLALPYMDAPDYGRLQTLAEEILEFFPEGPIYVCAEQDLAKALGQRLALMMVGDRPVLCIDRVKLPPDSYLDVGAPVGPALPVVIKTVIFGR